MTEPGNNTTNSKSFFTKLKEFLLWIIRAIKAFLLGIFGISSKEHSGESGEASTGSSSQTAPKGQFDRYKSYIAKLSPEEIIERSWDFLTAITEKVVMLSREVNNNILEHGRRLNKNEMAYIHIVPDDNPLPLSPAKAAAAANKEQLSGETQQR